MQNNKTLLIKIAEIGRHNSSKPDIQLIEPFRYFFNNQNNVIRAELYKQNGPWTQRELLARCLLLSAVLDQGPDMEGLRQMFIRVTNELYHREIRIFHRPLDFFKELGISIDSIENTHKAIKDLRSEIWAKENQSNPTRYNLFMDNSKQVLNYAIFRWGVPLCVSLLLEKNLQKGQKTTTEPLVEYIESCRSAELMSQEIKDNEKYGLGKAIGDKAGHLFAKWYVYSFGLVKRQDKGWSNLSFENPFDSNAGRVLFRTGFLLKWANLKDYEAWEVIQKGKGKGGLHYIRVTNIRGNKSNIALQDKKLLENYKTICVEYLCTHGRSPQTVEIQRIPNVLLLGSDYGIGELDDGLVYIGTTFCLNHENPKCEDCPINNLCEGYNGKRELIANYRT